MRTPFLLIILYFISSGCSAQVSKNGTDKKTLLKDYAICTCIEYGFQKQGITLNDPSRSVLMDLSEYIIPIDVKSKVDSSAHKFIDSIVPLQPGDYGNKTGVLYRCLEFGRSKELQKTKY
jgi:hypothetical protein